ncbi:MAG: nitrite/sulfite reductase, partial [Gammaproteobacteria bacterium]
YIESILRVYNLYGRRDNLFKARIKILVNALGIERFRQLVEEDWAATRGGSLTVPAEEIERIRAYFAPPPWETLADEPALLAEQMAAEPAFSGWYRANTHAHKTPGYRIVTLSLKAPGHEPGDLDAARMEAVADLADRYSFGELRVSHRQNLVFTDVRQRDLLPLWQALVDLDLATPNIGKLTDMIACPGLDYCALANARSIPVAQDISRHFADAGKLQAIGELTINISGCMNACGHHHVGNIGILGVDKQGQEFFQLTLGGASDQHAALGDRLGRGLPQAEVPAAIERIVDTYLSLRENDENFVDTYRRVGIEPFRTAVYGEKPARRVA